MFFEALTEGNPGGAQFLRQFADAKLSDPRFVKKFAENNPAGLLLVTELAAQDIVLTATGTWKPDNDTSVGEYAGTLAELINAKRFPLLERMEEKEGKNNARPGDQPGKRWGVTDTAEEKYQDKLSTVEAVKKKFKDLGIVASSAVVEGLEKQNLEAMLANKIGPVQDSYADDYDSRKDGKDQELLAFLALDPVESNGERQVAGVGALSINWRLQISRYKRKKRDDQHDTSLEIWVRSLRYRSVYKENVNDTTLGEQLEEDRETVGRAKGHDSPREPLPSPKLEIYKALPTESKSVFDRSILISSTSNERKALVLYAPDLQNVGCIDNTNSAASSEYEKSVATGFSLSASTTMSIQTSAEVSIEVVKASLTVGFSITFTAQYNKTTEETIRFSVPAGQRAFTYQGYLRAVVIKHDVSNGTYGYDASTHSHFFTNVLATSPEPLEGHPAKFRTY
ncbi:hypothetical protein ACF08M_38475 [Streptomyces sp. NPDC015032]|uniref:hypothetical protein n=1 Tax=Streptomyces sp. NPDC015032 TaxID=3364937 RepID=UPI0036F9222D